MYIVHAISYLLGIFFLFSIFITLREFTSAVLLKDKSPWKELKNLNPFYFSMGFQDESKHSDYRKRITALIMSAIIINGLALLILPYTNLGSTELDSQYKRKDFETHYYVHLHPYGSETKLYKLIAHVEYHDNSINIDDIYFPNSGHISVWDTYDDFMIGKKVDIVASNQERYTLELLDEKPNKTTLSKWKIID